MKDISRQYQQWSKVAFEVNKAVIPSLNKINTIGFISASLFIVFVSILLGPNKMVLISSVIPFSGFILVYLLFYKKLYGQGLMLTFLISVLHGSIVVLSYEGQFLELIYLFLAIIPWFPFNNLKLLKITYALSYLCFLIIGFQVKNYDLFEIAHWPTSILIYFFLMNLVFIVLSQFLVEYKKNNLEYILTITAKNKEIEDQNQLIQLNTKMLIKFEKEKHMLELANKQKDVEMLHINNQMKIKMKNDLIKELQKLKKKESNIVGGIQSIIQQLKYQTEEEKKIDLLQDNLNVVGSDFSNRIKQQFPELSRSEIELLSFIKLKLSNKQIAIQRNTSPNTINVALHRLKQKCDFESTADFKDFIESF